jgi:Helicase conserved C-terminal domain/SNF2-related domain/PLD-like domain
VTKRPRRDERLDDLFSVGSQPLVGHSLSALPWPEPKDFPVNHANAHVRDMVWADLVSSRHALVIAGFSSIANLVELVAAHAGRHDPGRVLVLLGTEPFSTDRVTFGSAAAAFTKEVRRYWIDERGVSLRLSAKVVQALTALQEGWLQVRFVPGQTRLHAKIYLGDDAVTLGSSNFTDSGMRTQFEANARFEKRLEPERFKHAAMVAHNYWDVGQDWSEELRALLEDLLQFVSWQEALARACADLLEGQWASRYLSSDASLSPLWPSQVAGIAEALWVVENVGSVLVADATGSGKTRMGAHLTRAVRDRLWSTGRVRGDLTVLVCPPAVQPHWLREAVSCGLTLRTVSHGLLSRTANTSRVHEAEVERAQILAVDEAHNFLTRGSNRTRQVSESTADHVLLFTATPINRGAEDLLSLVDLLGADNFEDETLVLLDQLGRRTDAVLTDAHQQLLRSEIQRFTVRRTKASLNDLVAQDPDAYRHPTTKRVCRYPEHLAKTYSTGETTGDRAVADQIRGHAVSLTGVSLLGKSLAVPATLARDYTDQRWLQMRLGSASGLASYHVLSAMRSSTAALLAHLIGTEATIGQLQIRGLIKPQPTGAIINSLMALKNSGPPRVDLACELPDWLTSKGAWQHACDQELALYESIRRAAGQLGDNRERAKARLLSELSDKHERILAFDRHPITLAAIAPYIDAADVQVVMATGATKTTRRQVQEHFAAESLQAGIALCTDAMSEGLNLQGASVIVHFDLPTTLRVAEQRVGRVDRMDSPYDTIEVFWPNDSPAFATRANELLAARNAESAALLGSNLPIPHLSGRDTAPLDIKLVIQAVGSRETQDWDGIQDALDPVRRLVYGPDTIIPPSVYATYRTETRRVLARVSPVRSSEPWAFFAVRGHDQGAPRWVLLDGNRPVITQGLDAVSRRLRDHLIEDPPSRSFDQNCESWLDRFLTLAGEAETLLIPRRLQRALQQMHSTCRHWASSARSGSDHEAAERWEAIARLAKPDDDSHGRDPYQVAEHWLQLVRPLRDAARSSNGRSRYSRLTDIDATLKGKPLPVHDVEAALGNLQALEPFDQRVSACILGVPETDTTD